MSVEAAGSSGRNGGAGSRGPLRLAFELNGAGRHPAAGRHLSPARLGPADLLTLRYSRAIAQQAEAAGFDLLVLADSLAPTAWPPVAVPGRLDALTVAAALGPLTTTIGLAPVVTTTHTEPFHVAKNLQSLDWVTRGRAAWKPEVSTGEAEARAFGRKGPADAAELWAEAADVVEVARRLWDSWEDGAIIRDAPTGRFIDRDRLHYIDFESERFSVRGPSITPRSPQAQPPILIGLHAASPPTAWDLAGREADLVVLQAPDLDALAVLRATLDRHLTGAHRSLSAAAHPAVLAVLDVTLDTPDATAAARRAALEADATAGRVDPAGTADGPPAAAYEGSGAGLAELFARWREAVDLDGFLLRPAVTPVDLAAFADTVAPLLPAPPGPLADADSGPPTLRQRLGWPRPANRYAPTA